MTDRDDWLIYVRHAAINHPPREVREPTVLIAIASEYLRHGDPDGTRIRVGSETVGAAVCKSGKSVRVVRRWLESQGLAHAESGSVPNKKAVWWHAAIPDVDCARCAFLGVRELVATSGPTPGPTPGPATGPTPGPSGGSRTVTVTETVTPDPATKTGREARTREDVRPLVLVRNLPRLPENGEASA